jgi:hypothetical protein
LALLASADLGLGLLASAALAAQLVALLCISLAAVGAAVAGAAAVSSRKSRSSSTSPPPSSRKSQSSRQHVGGGVGVGSIRDFHRPRVLRGGVTTLISTNQLQGRHDATSLSGDGAILPLSSLSKALDYFGAMPLDQSEEDASFM